MAALEKILLVDDEPNILASFRRNFRGVYEVHTAGSARAAIEIIRQNGPFAVVVSDQCMPDMSGIELFRWMHDQGEPSARIMLTGLGDQEVAIAALNEGRIFRFHTKSGQFDMLRRSIDDGVACFRDEMARRERGRAAARLAERDGKPETLKIRTHLPDALRQVKSPA